MTKMSLIVSTLGRSNEIVSMLESLERQEYRNFEVLVVDQNDDDRLLPVLDQARWSFPIRHIRTPDQRGLSKGRNVGLRHAAGDIFLFPDDDCWYPPWFLAKAIRLFALRRCMILAGRAADEQGRSINGRYETEPTPITRRNVWTTQIEWVVFFRREVFDQVGGYDVGLGTGASTPWRASEGQDLMLRALAAGCAAFFEPELYGHHAELPTQAPGEDMIAKGRSYARGMGYVLRAHRFGPLSAAYWVGRPAMGALASLIRGRKARCRYLLNVAIGRYEGWTRRCWN